MKLFHCFVQTYIQTPLRFVSKDEDDKEEETAQAESKKIKIRTLRHLTTELALLQLLIDYA